MNHGTNIVKQRGWRNRLAYVHDRIWSHGVFYLERRYIEFLGFSLRYHVFRAPDPDRGLHDHPWWFITFPLDSYWEQREGIRLGYLVREHRLHFRPATYRHRVVSAPARTFVLTGRRSREWGFYRDGEFIHWRDA